VVILHHIGGLRVLVIGGIVGSHQGERGLVVNVLSLAPHLLMRLR
jgi:hypothetical protein